MFFFGQLGNKNPSRNQGFLMGEGSEGSCDPWGRFVFSAWGPSGRKLHLIPKAWTPRSPFKGEV